MLNEKRNYSLLRPFDLEEVKRGEKICTPYGNPAIFIGVKSDGRIVFEDQDQLYDYNKGNLRMLPLYWLQGNPLYKGDTIYSTEDGSKHVVESFTGTYILCDKGLNEVVIHPDYASWEKPKVKKNYWGNLYNDDSCAYGFVGHKHPSKASADRGADVGRIACVMITIEE